MPEHGRRPIGEPTRAGRSVLMIDDDILLCRAVADHFERQGLHVTRAHSLEEARRAIAGVSIDVAILDEQLPDGLGHSLCAPLLEAHPHAKIVFITAYPSFEHAVTAIQRGAHDYVPKPFELEQLGLSVERCIAMRELERVDRVCRYSTEKTAGEAVLVGESQASAALRKLVLLASTTDAPVLITGETGTGKNLVASAIHYAGPRRAGPFIPVSCGALPETLVEAELFGWERGAFTGAVAAREGLLEMADGGSLLLDELAELPLQLQPKLLAVLEDPIVRRVGGRTSRRVDTRLIAATNGEVEELVREKKLRADLYYRLDVMRIHIPPLRERAEDIPSLSRHLLSKMGRASAEIGAAEERRLMAYSWPGNVRELRNVLERSLIVHGQELRPGELLRTERAPLTRASAPPGAVEPLADVERRQIALGLAQHDGNLTRAARALGISLSTLKRRVKQLQLPVKGST